VTLSTLIGSQGNRVGGVEFTNRAHGWDGLWFLVNAVMGVTVMHNVNL
jgi:hypothetical protein